MKYFWIVVIVTVSVGLIMDPALTMAVAATTIFGLLAFMPQIVKYCVND